MEEKDRSNLELLKEKLLLINYFFNFFSSPSFFSFRENIQLSKLKTLLPMERSRTIIAIEYLKKWVFLFRFFDYLIVWRLINFH